MSSAKRSYFFYSRKKTVRLSLPARGELLVRKPGNATRPQFQSSLTDDVIDGRVVVASEEVGEEVDHDQALLFSLKKTQ